MRTRRKAVKPSKLKGKLINQTIVCILLIISVMCIKSVNNKSVLIESVRESLTTSVDYKKTFESIRDMISRISNQGENANDTQNEQPDTPHKDTETLWNTPFNISAFWRCINAWFF